jgi:MFS family permease
MLTVCPSTLLLVLLIPLFLQVSDFYPDLSIKELGYRAGFMGSAFSLGSLCGNFMWGLAADRYGRRPALLCGLIGTVISATLFGFSPTFAVALLARFLWGFLNGNIGVSKTYVAEILDETNSHVGMSVFAVVGGIGRTIGPVIGGFLSTPAERYQIFKGTIFDTFPFALPSMTVATSCVIVFAFAYRELQETLRYSLVKKGHTGRKKTGGVSAVTDSNGVMSPRTAATQRRSRALTSVQYSQISTADEEDVDSDATVLVSSTSSSSSAFHAKRQGTAPAAKDSFGFDRLIVPDSSAAATATTAATTASGTGA